MPGRIRFFGRLRGLLALPRLVAGLLRDRRVSVVDRALFVLALGYLASPIDPVPDFLVGLGLFDDLGVLTFALQRLVGRAPSSVVAAHWQGRPEALARLGRVLSALGFLRRRRRKFRPRPA